MATELIEREDTTEQALSVVMAIADECALPSLRNMNEAQKTLRIARGTMQLEKAMTDKPLMAMLRSLCGNELGFGCDKQYDDTILRRAAIVALMKGARLTSFNGPEWMILSNRCYLCKPFYQRSLEELNGISNVIVRCEAHEQGDSQTAYVPCVVELRDHGRLRRWEFRRTEDKDKAVVDRRIAVRVNAGMIVDAILGKAESKALRRVYAELQGEELPDDEAAIDVSSGMATEPQLFDKEGMPANENRKDDKGGTK